MHAQPTAPRRGAIGVVVRDGLVLVVRRAPQLQAGGRWCFPGGHVEPGETSAEAVVRELQEELSTVVETVQHLGEVEVTAPAYVLDVWTVRHVSGELVPRPEEISDLRWMAPGDVPALDPAMTSNALVLALLRR